ncbi:MAG TPA: long-chain fatty acid--CoA ligase [Candidatus Anoxymicrobiaceae bacterium]
MDPKPWYSSYVPGVPEAIDYEKMTVSASLSRSARQFPDAPALIFMGKKISFSELDALVNGFARALMGLGINKGDKVAMILPNIPQVVIANMATLRIGAVVVMNNPLYTEHELAHQLDDSDSRIALTIGPLVPRVLSAMPETKLEKVVACNINDYLPFPKKQLFPYLMKAMYKRIETSDRVLDFMTLMKSNPPDPVEDRGEWEELSTLLYTGGTTGVSKGVMLSHRNISSNVQQFHAWFPDLNDGEVSLIGTFPIFHSAGYTAMQNAPVWGAWTHIMIPRPEPKTMIELLKKHRPQFLPGVPAIFVGLLATPEFREMDLSFIKGFFSGAAPLAIDTIKDLHDLTGANMVEVYGMTETTPIASAHPYGGLVKPGTVGIPMPDTDIKVVDAETGASEMPVGEVGEIIISGPQVMMGYYKKPDETAAILRDGWIFTGDLGFMDEDGYISVVDRKKDMVISSGFNVYPVEVDDVLFSHPKVLEACTIGVPDSYRGESLKAFVVLKEGETATEEEIIEFTRENLAAYKVPKSVEFIDELPKTAVGKILRRELRDMELSKTDK